MMTPTGDYTKSCIWPISIFSQAKLQTPYDQHYGEFASPHQHQLFGSGGWPEVFSTMELHFSTVALASSNSEGSE